MRGSKLRANQKMMDFGMSSKTVSPVGSPQRGDIGRQSIDTQLFLEELHAMHLNIESPPK